MIKALTGHYTARGSDFPEYDMWKKIAAAHSPHCWDLYHSFIAPGKGSAGEHRCFVSPVYGGTVQALYNDWSLNDSEGPIFPRPFAKKVLLHLLRGIAALHKSHIKHCDVTMDNIFFDVGIRTTDIEKVCR